tara:strand:+ start:10125 stop:10283 length:159 start_codon:yes stop_codon:yes gene_type:complete
LEEYVIIMDGADTLLQRLSSSLGIPEWVLLRAMGIAGFIIILFSIRRFLTKG